MTFLDIDRLSSSDEIFRISFIEQGRFWQLSTTYPEAFQECHECGKELDHSTKKMFCTKHHSIYCNSCDTGKSITGVNSKWIVNCFHSGTEQHTHFNISHIEEINKQIQGDEKP